MSISTFVALRYLTSGRRNKFFSWIALLSIGGVAIGVATMIVVLSVINGFETELKNRFLNANAHILAFRYPNGLTNTNSWTRRIQNDFKNEITGVSPFVHYETMVIKGSVMQSVLVRGFNPRDREKVQSLDPWISPKSAVDILQKEADQKISALPDLPSIIIGTGILTILDIKIGDTVQLISPQSERLGDVQPFRVVGTYNSGLKHYDNRLIAMALPVAQRFFDMKNRVTGLEIGLIDPDKSIPISKEMREKYSLSVKEWQSFNRPLMDALEMERAVIFLIVCLIAVVAGFNILTTLFVAVTQKQKEISILKAMGATNFQIISLFLKQGFLFGLLGSIFGSLLALGVSYIIEKYQFIDLPDPYFLTNLPMEYDWRLYAVLSFLGAIICVIAGIFPAISAMKVVPSEGIRGIAKRFQ